MPPTCCRVQIIQLARSLDEAKTTPHINKCERTTPRRCHIAPELLLPAVWLAVHVHDVGVIHWLKHSTATKPYTSTCNEREQWYSSRVSKTTRAHNNSHLSGWVGVWGRGQGWGEVGGSLQTLRAILKLQTMHAALRSVCKNLPASYV